MARKPVYVLASAVARVASPVLRKCPFSSVRKILVIGSGGVGDIIMKTPVFDCLREAFPEAEIVFFTSSGPERLIIMGHPGIDRVITLDAREAMTPRHPWQALSYLRKLRAERFDMTLTTHQGIRFRGALFSYLLGAPIRVGFDKGGRGSLYNFRVKVADADSRHATDWNLDLVRALGIDVGKRHLSIALSSEDRGFASEFLAGHKVDDSQLVVGIFPGSKRLSRLWPAGRFAAVADALCQRYRSRVLLLGGERERGMIEEIGGRMDFEPIVAIGQSIKQTAALIERCGLLVSTDSGPMHIAAAVKTPVVALFGPETPVRVRPYTDRAAIVKHDMPCSPCHSYTCKLGTTECMEAITVGEVLAAIEANSAAWELDRYRAAPRT